MDACPCEEADGHLRSHHPHSHHHRRSHHRRQHTRHHRHNRRDHEIVLPQALPWEAGDGRALQARAGEGAHQGEHLPVLADELGIERYVPLILDLGELSGDLHAASEACFERCQDHPGKAGGSAGEAVASPGLQE